MRRKILFGITLTAVVAFSAVAIFAYTDPYASSGHPTIGPRIARYMVARNDVGTGGPLQTPPPDSMKPIPVQLSVARPGNTMSGINTHSGSIMVATTTPQARLEGSLKSLALDLR